MANKEFTSREKGMIKSVAKTVYPMYARLYKLQEQVRNLENEIEIQQKAIDNWEKGVMDLTGGFTSMELVEREVVNVGKDGKDIRKAIFKLRYEDTVIPPMEDCTVEDITPQPINPEPINPEPIASI
jgi:predicted RNase H-like nuclease (RuvC/YqgF family)